jgi:hypothetical protein
MKKLSIKVWLGACWIQVATAVDNANLVVFYQSFSLNTCLFFNGFHSKAHSSILSAGGAQGKTENSTCPIFLVLTLAFHVKQHRVARGGRKTPMGRLDKSEIHPLHRFERKAIRAWLTISRLCLLRINDFLTMEFFQVNSKSNPLQLKCLGSNVAPQANTVKMLWWFF